MIWLGGNSSSCELFSSRETDTQGGSFYDKLPYHLDNGLNITDGKTQAQQLLHSSLFKDVTGQHQALVYEDANNKSAENSYISDTTHSPDDHQTQPPAVPIMTSDELYEKRSQFLTPDNKYMCPICHKVFRNVGHLRDHYYLHTNEKPFTCPFCPYRGRQSSRITQHIRVRHHAQYKMLMANKSLK